MASPQRRAAASRPLSSALEVAAPTATIDSPMAMMMISPNRSAKCEALCSRHVVERTRYTPSWSTATAASHHHFWAVPPANAPATSRVSTTEVTPSMREDDAAQLGVVTGGDEVDAEVGEAHDGVGDRQHERGVALALERVRDADGDEEHADHRHHHGDAQQALVGLRLIAEPRVGAPPEPHDGERDQTLEQRPRRRCRAPSAP